ncbi:DUF4177 domain-containing protein [bacterium AH-315-K03]|nr:DUF4177 domain-containing protein [bacterium AH-315-K03]
MNTYEYKTIDIGFNLGLFKKKTSNFENSLNKEGRQGWQLKQVIMPSGTFGESEKMLTIFERCIEV